MNNNFKQVCELVKKIEMLYMDKCYNNDKIKKMEKILFSDEKQPNFSKEDIQDRIIKQNQIIKEGLEINIYIIKLKRILPIEFDDDYNMKPIQEKEFYESGIIISKEEQEEDRIKTDTINGLYVKQFLIKSDALKYYEELNIKVNTLKSDDLLIEVINDLKLQIEKIEAK